MTSFARNTGERNCFAADRKNEIAPMMRVLDALRARGKSVRLSSAGNKARAQCPAHADRTASLSVTDAGDKVLIHCFGGCSLTRVLEQLDLPTAALRQNMRPLGPRTVVASYDYRLGGDVVARKLRYSDKNFMWQRPDGNGWRFGLGGLKVDPYQLDGMTADTVFIVEGEKSCDRLAECGIASVSPPFGANGWKDVWSVKLWASGASTLVVLPDADAPGRRHADAVVESLMRTRPDRPVTVKCVALPGLSAGADVFDFLDTHTADELRALVAASAGWQPVDKMARKRELTRLRVRKHRAKPKNAQLFVSSPTVEQKPVTLRKSTDLDRSSCYGDDLLHERYSVTPKTRAAVAAVLKAFADAGIAVDHVEVDDAQQR
jgi:hypothetical protein